jgi:hypothetical protein
VRDRAATRTDRDGVDDDTTVAAPRGERFAREDRAAPATSDDGQRTEVREPVGATAATPDGRRADTVDETTTTRRKRRFF